MAPNLWRQRQCALTLVAMALLSPGGWAAPQPPGAAVASAHPVATAAGHEILAAGGNAFDAAVAVSATLAVVEPYSSGLGGGGFWLLHRAEDGHQVMVDGRERAPLAAHRDMYLDASGEVIPGRSVDGPLAAGIPGEPAALVYIAERYGRLPLSHSLAPAIRAAREGFAVDDHYRRMAGFRREVLLRSPEAAAVFLDDGTVPTIGHRIRQPDLADTLEHLARSGRAGFYAGPVARRLVDGMRAAGGIWSLEDLQRYRVVEREPVRAVFGGMTVTSAAPPSSGGVLLVEILNILSGYDLDALEPPRRVHFIVEAMRRAYRDRAEYLGDPDFVSMPLGRLASPEYAAGLRAGIHPDEATPSTLLAPVSGAPPAGNHTTHFSILDGEGNRVAATLSINYPFGAGFVVPGTGVLVNDEMDDFAAKPGVPNVYGLVGNEVNAVAPGKRPLSSMTPTFVESERGVAILGTPGGSRIISMVLLGILEYADGRDADALVRAPRFHHQYLPDVVELEPEAVDADGRASLELMGHTLQEQERPWGNMQAVTWEYGGALRAASDPRGVGAAEVRPWEVPGDVPVRAQRP